MHGRGLAGLVVSIALLWQAGAVLGGPREAVWKPSRPVSFIVPWGAGGGADQLARFVGPRLEKYFGTPFPVLNVPGATGGVGMTKLLGEPADGHAIAIYIGDTHAVVATGRAAWSLRDLAPIARLQKMPSFLFVRREAPWKTFEELEREVKAAPGRFKTAILGKGSIDEVTLTFMAERGFRTVLVPYASPSERYASLLGGHTDILYEQAGDVLGFLKDGRMRPVLVFSERRVSEFPDVPSAREMGYPIYLPQFRGIVAKAGTPAEVVSEYERAFGEIARSPQFRSFNRELHLAAEDSYLGASSFRAFLEREQARMEYLMRQLGLRR